ncbi:hypothetical protein AZ54_01545 [Xanthomonas oryzae pv. oryzae PXO86]|uniref:Uncharacterized protein n=1 Tax=Xanthomonas oryzae pv. oryzae (strain KACC10331 / KXO85) TaxID=291331 RepID=Q05HQ6_XANOR|nr:hypothetical protein XOO4947 [Xanthomonas oryzae pv. oryzae KACC 10331]AJQ85355.1 hypothetical protein AZ54_01545 [Xanthomonas oryzae pv. oryzae PXO86]
MKDVPLSSLALDGLTVMLAVREGLMVMLKTTWLLFSSSR